MLTADRYNYVITMCWDCSGILNEVTLESRYYYTLILPKKRRGGAGKGEENSLNNLSIFTQFTSGRSFSLKPDSWAPESRHSATVM